MIAKSLRQANGESKSIFKDLCIYQTPNIVFHLNIKLAHKSLNSECLSAVQ